LRIAAGLRPVARGHIRFGDQLWLDTQRGIDIEPERRSIGFVFQDYALFPHLGAWQNIAFGLRRLPKRQRRDAAYRLLEQFGVAQLAEARPDQLSGGERQRVALARALAPSPALLLLDEPLSALDSRTRVRATRELNRVLSELKVPTVLVTHDFAEAAQLADRIAIVDRGAIVQRGTPSELIERPASSFVADFAGATVLTGSARQAMNGLTEVELDGGGTIFSTDELRGRVGASVFPWEITLRRARSQDDVSSQNEVAGRVASMTTLGNRVRVGLELPQHLTAEVTSAAAAAMSLREGDQIQASWKATATRLSDL
jgi:molybdate transport system ATP-binding protein